MLLSSNRNTKTIPRSPSIGPDFKSTMYYVANREYVQLRRRIQTPTRRILRQWAADCARSPSAVGAHCVLLRARIVSQSWQKAGCRRGCLVHGSVPMPILIPFGHPFGLLLRPLRHVLNCVVLGKLLFKSLGTGSSRVINQQPARSEMNFVTRFLGRSLRKDCFLH